jgi:hypothetical protein
MQLPDFAELISGYTAEFCGRGWLDERLSALLDEPDCRIVVLTGGAGVGKTAFLAHLASLHADWLRYFIRRDSSILMAPGDARTFLLTVGGQLAASRPSLFAPDKLEIMVRQRVGTVAPGGVVSAARIAELRASPFFKIAMQVQQDIGRVEGKVTGLEIGVMIADARQYSVPDLQFLGLVDPLKVLAEADPTARVVVLVDALDELRYSSTTYSQDALQVLVSMPDLARLSNLRFVVSSRPEGDMLDELLSQPGARLLALGAEEQENLADLQSYVAAVVGKLARADAFPTGFDEAAFTQALTSKASGNFLYARSVLAPIRETTNDPGKRSRLPALVDIEKLPADLSALYRHFLRNIERWCRREFPERTWRGYLAPLLGTLAVAQEPLSENQLVAFTGLAIADVMILLGELRQFVEELGSNPIRYRIYHTSFAQHLTEHKTAGIHHLPAVDCHRRIARAFGGELPVWDRASLEQIDDYGLTHLAVHLGSAEWPDHLHSLIGGTWAGIHERRDGHFTGFLADLAVARSFAEAAADIGLTARYSLFEASIRGLTTNLPSPLVRSLLDHGLWAPRRALEVARQAGGNDEQQGAILMVLAPSLTPDLFAEALALARSLGSATRRAETLAALIPLAPGSTQEVIASEALTIRGDLENDSNRAWLLTEIAANLPQSSLGKALDVAAEIRFLDARAQALAALLPRLGDDLIPKATAVVDELAGTEPVRPEFVDAMSALALRLAEPRQKAAWRRALETTLALHDETKLVESLAARATQWPSELLPVILETVLQLNNPYALTKAVAVLLPLCPTSAAALLDAGLAAVQRLGSATDRTRALAAFLPGLAMLPGARRNVLRVALAEARKNDFENARVIGLALLIPHLNHGEQDAVKKEALERVRQPDNGYRRVEALTMLAPVLTPAARRELVALATALDNEDSRVAALAGLAPYLTPEQLDVALDAAPQIANDYARFQVLAALSPHLPPSSLTRAVGLTRTIRDTDEQTQALAAFAVLVPPAKSPVPAEQIVARVNAITVADTRAETLLRLVPWLPEPLKEIANDCLAEALLACRSSERLHVLRGRAIDLPPGALDRLLDRLKGLQNISERNAALFELGATLPASDALALVGPAFALQFARSKGEALARIMPRLQPAAQADALRRVLARSKSIHNNDWAETIAALAPALSPEDAARAFKKVRSAPRGEGRSAALAALLSQLPLEHRGPAMDSVAQSLRDASQSLRVDMLTSLARLVPWKRAVADAALSAAREIDDPITQAKALAALLPGLEGKEQPAIAIEAFGLLEGTISDPIWMVLAVDRLEPLSRLAPWRSTLPRWSELLEKIYSLSDAKCRAEAHVRFADLEPANGACHLTQAIADGVACHAKLGRYRAWNGLAEHWQQLPILEGHQIWNAGLRAMASRPRSDTLLDLAFFARLALHLGGEFGVVRTMNAIEEACSIWP